MASAKKPRAAKPSSTKKPRTEKAATDWTESYRWFIEACDERFAFLRERGFAEAVVHVIAAECTVKYLRGTDIVSIQTEYFGEPFTLITSSTPPQRFGLRLFRMELAPDEHAREPKPSGPVLDQREMLAFLDFDAGFLKAHVDEILSPAPALLAKLDARVAKALREQ